VVGNPFQIPFLIGLYQMRTSNSPSLMPYGYFDTTTNSSTLANRILKKQNQRRSDLQDSKARPPMLISF